MKVAYFPEALEELEEAVRYYDGKRPGLGDEFFDEVQEAIGRIKGLPKAWSLVGKSTRVCQTHRFPYGIVYKIVNNTLVIVAVMHLHRRPGYWKRRLK